LVISICNKIKKFKLILIWLAAHWVWLWIQATVHIWQALTDLWPLPVGVPATFDPLGAILIRFSSGDSVEKMRVAVC